MKKPPSTKAPPKVRLDLFLVQSGLVSTRSKAQALILAGHVLVDDVPVTKAGEPVSPESVLRLKEPEHPYVSRGALKLKHALNRFGISAQDKIGLDVGASTGGFTEVLIEEGARRVFAVDVGSNQLDWKIRSHPLVTSYEKVNARELDPKLFEDDPVDLIVMDVSFISLSKIFPGVLKAVRHQNIGKECHGPLEVVALIKPQFELDRNSVSRGEGVITSEDLHQRAISSVKEAANSHGLEFQGLIESPIKGTKGNKEFLGHWIDQQDEVS